ncbi:MAG: aldolase [Bacteroidota bacterium]
MKQYRLNRLFNPKSNKCLDVAIDHGFFNQPDFLTGIENIEKAVKLLVDADPDAIQLTAGQSKHLQKIPGKKKPALVLRTDVANVYGKSLMKRSYSIVLKECIERAVSLDAACVCINLFQIPNAPEVTEQCILNILEIMPVAHRMGMPVMIEPLVFKSNGDNMGYSVNGDENSIIPLVRQAVELGADLIKADPTADISKYHKVVETAGDIPVLVRGGGRAPDKELLERTEKLNNQGISGIVYGRNIIQHQNPKGITLALKSIIHENLSAKEAMKML